MKDRIYFPGLNGIRFFAAFMVIISHIEGFKHKGDYPNIFDFTWLASLGPHGVKVFFALSGFLITYLLLIEKNKTGKINSKKFYIRRILRIWPLYFLILILGFFIIPLGLTPEYFASVQEQYFAQKLTLSIFLLPNLSLYVFGSFFSLGLLWSIGTEEQFYLIWPQIVKRKSILHFLIITIFIFLIIKITCNYFIVNYTDIWNFYVIKCFRIPYMFLQHDLMMIGGIFAFMHYYNWKKLLTISYNWKTQTLCFLLIITGYIFNPPLGGFNNIIYGIAYGIIILNISTNEKSILKLEKSKLLNYLGKISYGLYMYHSIAIGLSIWILSPFLQSGSLWINVALYLITLTITVSLASLSYFYFEKPFLNIKEKYMIIRSSS